MVCIRIMADEQLIDDMKRYIVTTWSLISLRKDTRDRGGFRLFTNGC